MPSMQDEEGDFGIVEILDPVSFAPIVEINSGSSPRLHLNGQFQTWVFGFKDVLILLKDQYTISDSHAN